ncbi:MULTISPECIES: DUF7285 family protein [Haloarcula]|uniref:DUF7285 family protein n=1 Tax=Haloarcula TaxID=2237 RepID=UPI0023E8AFAE|nr:hypothetical protein [Halomicroarcula sp. SHR3]
MTFLAVGLAMYGNVITDVLPGGSDEAIEQVTLDRVWEEINEDGRYPDDGSPVASLPPETFPEGNIVYVSVTRLEGDTTVTEEEHKFDSDGQRMSDVERPDDPQRAQRPIPVEVGPADVDGGTLTVEVWD